MQHVLKKARRTLTPALLGAVVFMGALSAQASDINVSNARLSLVPGNTPGAGYFDIANESETAITLLGADSDAFEAVEMHESTEHEGMAHMHAIAGVEIAAGESFSFVPRGHHLMFMGRVDALEEGDEIEVTLEFESERVPVVFEVVSPASL
ncbi:copper chaperone PCu(A)C [Vreelandella sp. EE22]